jgi:hypothetical protein
VAPDPAVPAPPAADVPAPYWKCVVAAAPPLLVALQFAFAHWNLRLFGLSDYDLTGALAVEAIALYAAMMFGIFWAFLSGGPFLRRMRNWQMLIVFAACAGAAYAVGASEALQFLVMAAVTFFGLLLSWKQPSALMQAASRWAVAYAALALAASMFHTPESITNWRGDPRVLDAGTLYFFLIAAVELSGLHLRIVPRYRVLVMTKLYGMVGKAYP